MRVPILPGCSEKTFQANYNALRAAGHAPAMAAAHAKAAARVYWFAQHGGEDLPAYLAHGKRRARRYFNAKGYPATAQDVSKWIETNETLYAERPSRRAARDPAIAGTDPRRKNPAPRNTVPADIARTLATASMPYGARAGDRRSHERQKANIARTLAELKISKGTIAGVIDAALSIQASENRGGSMMLLQNDHVYRALNSYGLIAPANNPVSPLGISPAEKARIRAQVASMTSASGAAVRRAAALYTDFSGHEDIKVAKVRIPGIPQSMLAIGKCDGILYSTVRDGEAEKYIHRFKAKSRPLLCVSPDGKQLYLLGGAYDFTERGIVDKP